MASLLKNSIGILGGSFDPVHSGHLRLALESMEAAGLERVILLPLYTPTHRADLVATPEQRYHMLELATDSVPELEVSDIEIRRKQPSYTIDTINELHQQDPTQPISLIMGMDAFQHLDSWKEWEQLLDMCNIIVAERSGIKSVTLNPRLTEIIEARKISHPDELHSGITGRIMKIGIPVLDISSTQIRKLLSLKLHIDFLVPEPVKEYILKQNIYFNN